MIQNLIYELVNYGIKQGLVNLADQVYVTNSLLELFELSDYQEPADTETKPRALHEILEDMMAYAYEKGIMKENSIVYKDLFDTKIMSLLMGRPSEIRAKFKDLYENQSDYKEGQHPAYVWNLLFLKCQN